MTMASAMTASHQPLRIVSRRAQHLLQKHRAKQGGQSANGGAAASKAAPKKDETPWPKSLRYTFYTACVISVPLSIGQAIALSPRLRDWMLPDDVEDDGNSSSSGFSSREIISLVRSFWGHEDYVPAGDQPQLKHIVPGHRDEWHEDNYSSLLNLFGMFTPKVALENNSSLNNTAEESIPMSLDNEPPSNIRSDQKVLSQYLSTKTNPSGVKTRLSLFSRKDDLDEGSFDSDEAGYETECTLPGNLSTAILRELCKGSDAQGLKRDLAESDPDFQSKSTNERIRTKSWNEDCAWVVSFPGSEDDNGGAAGNVIADEGGIVFSSLMDDGSTQSTSQKASKDLRHSTAVHSSWSYFPELATQAASPLGSNSVNATMGSTTATGTSNESLDMLRLKHQISTLEKDINDPSSLRDRDSMYEELKLAKRELRSLKPWWKRFQS